MDLDLEEEANSNQGENSNEAKCSGTSNQNRGRLSEASTSSEHLTDDDEMNDSLTSHDDHQPSTSNSYRPGLGYVDFE